jgi:DNA-binding CsgD family transcriptional regulator
MAKVSPENSPKRLFGSIGLGFWQAWWMLAMCTDILLPTGDNALFSVFLIPLVLAITALGYLAVVFLEKRFTPLTKRSRILPATALFCCVGTLGMAVSAHGLVPDTLASVCFFAALVLFSLGNALLLILWGELWSTLAMGQVGRHLYISYAFAFVPFFLIPLLPLLISIIIIALLPLCSLLILRNSQNEPRRKPLDIGYEIEALSKVRIFLAIILLNIVWGFYQGTVGVLGNGVDFTQNTFLVAGICLAALVLNLIIAAPTVEPFALFKPIMPAIAGGLILTTILPVELLYIGDGFVVLGGYCLDILIMLVSCDIAFRARMPVALTFGVTIFIARCGSLIGMLISRIDVFAQAGAVSIGISLAAVLVVLVGTLLFTQADLQKLYSVHAPVSADAGIDKKSHLIAKRCGLSSREEDVLILLAYGRSAPYIGQELSIAVGTVKRHISNIYRKIGVYDRQSLHDVIENGKLGKGD